jgi:diguanylate cyclase (GGDEF)-like protein
VVLLPDADRSHFGLVLALAAFAAAMGAFMILGARRIGEAAHSMSAALAVACVALGVYLTGGTTSPLLPLVFLIVTFSAYFSSPQGALIRFGGAVLICASPFAYTVGDAGPGFVVRFVALVTTAAVLVGLILYNRRELDRAEQLARELASYDPLTRLLNRRGFERHLSVRLQPAGALQPLSVAIIDLDNFKSVNDVHGHAAGDRVLKAIAGALEGVTRPQDRIARIGGDEFALVAQGADASRSRALGVRCVRAVERAVAEAGYSNCGVSATVGYALFPEHGVSLDALVEAADTALMRAKNAGKRRVACAVADASTRAPAPSSPMALAGSS